MYTVKKREMADSSPPNLWFTPPSHILSHSHLTVKKREVDDSAKKLGQLLWRLNAGEVSSGVLPKLLALCAALEAMDWHTANHVQVRGIRRAEGGLEFEFEFVAHVGQPDVCPMLSNSRYVFFIKTTYGSKQPICNFVFLVSSVHSPCSYPSLSPIGSNDDHGLGRVWILALGCQEISKDEAAGAGLKERAGAYGWACLEVGNEAWHMVLFTINLTF